MSTLYLIDDDKDFRDYLRVVIESLEIKVISFSNAADFFKEYNDNDSGCILSDIFMPDMDGLEFQDELITREIDLPLILMSAHGSISIVKSVLKKGAIDFLEKPIEPKELLDSVKYGMSLGDRKKLSHDEHDALHDKLKTLSHREYQILEYLVLGQENSDIAEMLNISVRTVETHRNHLLHKMGYSSLKKLLTSSLITNSFQKNQ